MTLSTEDFAAMPDFDLVLNRRDVSNGSGTAETGVIAVKHPDTVHQQMLKVR